MARRREGVYIMKVDAYQDIEGCVHKTRDKANAASVIALLDLVDGFDMDIFDAQGLAKEILSKMPTLIAIERDRS